MKGEKRQILGIDFGDSPDRLKRKYLDICKGGHAKVLHLTKYDECSDLSTTYLEKIDMTSETKIKAEEKFPISGQGYMVRKLSDDT